MRPPIRSVPLALAPVARVAMGIVLATTASACKAMLSDSDVPEPDRLDLGGCTRAEVIDDGEDNDHRVLVHSERGGYMYTFVDDSGSTITPTAGAQGGVFAFHVGGANGSMYGGRFYGDLGHGEILFAGYGLNFVDPKETVDASLYDGISFFGRRAPDSIGKVRLKLPDRNTDPQGGVCSECFNDFGKDFEFTEHWKQYVVPFEDMQQMPYWGNPRPTTVDPTGVYAIQFQVSTPGAHYDIWVDDITFYGCSDAAKAKAAADAAEASEE